jgi:hypothetical protein
MKGRRRSAPPGTGKSIRLRACDAVTVEDRLPSHRFYYDQMELMGQLGHWRETDSGMLRRSRPWMVLSVGLVRRADQARDGTPGIRSLVRE